MNDLGRDMCDVDNIMELCLEKNIRIFDMRLNDFVILEPYVFVKNKILKELDI